MRLRGAVAWKVFWWTWNEPFGYLRDYYDGWRNQINFGLFCITWITPPLKGDLE